MYKFRTLSLSLLIAAVFSGCNDKDNPDNNGEDKIAVTSVLLNSNTATVEVGKTITLVATVQPDNADNKGLTWSSTSLSVATVADGVVTGVSTGTTTITVTTSDGSKTANCVVMVINETLDENPAISVENEEALIQTIFADGTDGKSDLTFVTTGAWTSSAGLSSWISIYPDHGNEAGTYTVSIGLDPNSTGEERMTTIKITCNGEDITITVTQMATKEDGTPYDPNEHWIPQKGDVYVAGTSLDQAKLWKNGVEFDLVRGDARSVFVSGNNVYVAGHRDNRARLWKNGVLLQSLTHAIGVSVFNSVFVSGNDVYVAGHESGSQGSWVAKLWKNGEAQDFTDGIYHASANSVYISGTDVYVAGNRVYDAQGRSEAILWKNGIAQKLTEGTFRGSANSVYVSGDDVYVVGTHNWNGNDIPMLWQINDNIIEAKELVPQPNMYSSSANSVYVSGSDVYIAGTVGGVNGSIATLWINGVAHNIDGGSSAQSVFISGIDVFVVGGAYENGNSNFANLKLWKNGKVEQNLTQTDGINRANAFSVFVVE